MKSVGAGVVLLDSHGGYLDLTPAALDQLVSKEPISHHYQVEHTPFARGKFAAVRRARCLRSGTWYAAKVMRKRRRAQDVRHEILHEAAVLLLARPSSRIVSLHQLYETTSEIILVLELAEGGELQRVIDEEESLGEESVRRYMTNILGALRFLHAHNIAHLDVKPQNLLLTGEHPSSEVKLCDFGISRIILSDIEVREVLGTPDYVAPEILQYEPISLATDMWSVGVLAYVLLTGHSPFGGNTKQETFLNISQGQVDFPEELFSGVSSAAIDFITQLLIVDPGCRLTVQEAMEHQWLSGIQSPSHPLPSPTATPTTTATTTTTPTTNGTCTPPKSPSPAPHHPVSPSGMASYHYMTGGGSGGSGKENVQTSQTQHSNPTSTPPSRRGINKENNRNTINKTKVEEQLAASPVPAAMDSPSKPRPRPPHPEKAKRESDVGARKPAASGKENKEVKEVKLRPSPLCLRRQGSKCDLKSPGDQHKCGAGQGSVSIILEKGIIC